MCSLCFMWELSRSSSLPWNLIPFHMVSEPGRWSSAVHSSICFKNSKIQSLLLDQSRALWFADSDRWVTVRIFHRLLFAIPVHGQAAWSIACFLLPCPLILHQVCWLIRSCWFFIDRGSSEHFLYFNRVFLVVSSRLVLVGGSSLRIRSRSLVFLHTSCYGRARSTDSGYEPKSTTGSSCCSECKSCHGSDQSILSTS